MTVEGDWQAQMPYWCQAGRGLRGWIKGWREPCPDRASQYLVSDDIDLPDGISVFYTVHEALEAWLCGVHMTDLLVRLNPGQGRLVRRKEP